MNRNCFRIGMIIAVSAAIIGLLPAEISAQARRGESAKALETFEQVFRFIEENYVDEPDPQQLLEGALKGLLESLDDPYSVYLDPESVRDLSDTTEGEFGGVGMYITKQRTEEDGVGYIEVIAPIEGTPAYRAGINAGDLIIAVEDESTFDLTTDEVVLLLRGAPGSTVNITVQRGENITFPVPIVRAFIEIPTVRMDIIPDRIGFLRITNFTPFTDERVREAIAFFERNNYRALIIDLRDNPGGLLAGVIDTADLFLSRGTIVGTQGRTPSENDRFTASRGQLVADDIPIVVLINRGSASASEILAAALQDRDRATLLGTTTFGKGSVQQVRRVGEGGFRLTMSRYYTPDGRFIDQVGVQPDIEFAPPELDDAEIEVYNQLLADGTIREYVSSRPQATEADIDQFVAELRGEGVVLNERYLRRLVRNELNRINNVVAVYDLEFDVTLQEAIKLLNRQLGNRR